MKTRIVLIAFICSIFFSLKTKAQHNYGEVLQKSMFFYEAQQAGYLSQNNRVTWRADAAIEDGSDVGIDLTGGWFDAGDHVKFNFPMAYSVTTLCWGYLENQDAFTSTGQTEIFLENIKHVTDYFIKCHTSANELYAQAGDGDEDHKYWVPAEVIDIRSERPSFKIDAANPGSDLAAETAAALAAASMVFKNSNPSYSALLLEHARELYSFADTYRGKYSDVIPVGSFYKSWSGYQDELCWGAIWLYKATQSETYLTKARQEYNLLSNEERESVKTYGWTLAWDDKSYGCYVLMATITGEEEYNADAERHLEQWFSTNSDSKGPKFTPAGFPILDSWGSFRYAANTAFLMLEQSDNMTDAAKRDRYRDRAKEIIDYILGDNPQNTSYVIGYGNRYPLFPHHRTAHGPWSREEKVPVETRHILYGALVGGHKTNSDTDWVDDRHDYYWNEVACDYNSLFTGVVARLYSDFGGSTDPNFPVAEIPNGEFLVECKMNSSGNTHSEYAVWAHNRTAWPARIPGFKFRIFINISEGIEAGYSASDYIVSANTTTSTYSDLIPQDAANGIYFVEVTYNDDQVIYPGGQGESKRESQVRVRLPYDAPASAWDPTNDWSAQGIGGDLAATPYIPLYANGVLVYGKEPGPIEEINVTSVSVAPESVTLNKGQTTNLNETVLPVNATNKNVTWSSDNPNFATVNNTGVVTAVAEGRARIVVTTEDGGFTSACNVTVTDIQLPTYTLTVDTTGFGTVSMSPEGGVYDEGTVVTIAATPGAGFVFDQWGGDASGTSATTSITMDANKTVMASFAPLSNGCNGTMPITLPFEYDGPGTYCWETTGTIEYINSWNVDKLEINGIDITNNYTSSMPARIDGKYQIYYEASVNWAHAEIVGTGGSDDPVYTLSSSVVGLGTVNPSGGTYVEGTEVSVTATPEAGWRFLEWGGGASGPNAATTIIMDSDIEVIATFIEIDDPEEYSINVTTTGQGTVSLDPEGGVYTEGTAVTLTAVADANWNFLSWDGDAAGTSETITITVDADKNIIANFEESISDNCNFNTPRSNSLPSVNEAYSYIHVLGNGPDLSNVSNFTINWDLANNGLWQFSMNTTNGSPNWYVDLRSSLTQNFALAQPSLILSGSGFNGLDGSYYVTVDENNFVMVEQSGAYAISFNNSPENPCVKSATAIKTYELNKYCRAFPNPAKDEITVSGLKGIQAIKIYSPVGQTIYDKQLFGEATIVISLQEFKAGTYIISFESADGSSESQLLLIK